MSFVDNAAEWVPRMVNLRNMVSGCFRIATGTERFRILRIVIETPRRKGWGTLEAPATRPDQLSGTSGLLNPTGTGDLANRDAGWLRSDNAAWRRVDKVIKFRVSVIWSNILAGPNS